MNCAKVEASKFMISYEFNHLVGLVRRGRGRRISIYVDNKLNGIEVDYALTKSDLAL